MAAARSSRCRPGGVGTAFASGLSSPVGLAFNPITGALFVAQQGTDTIAEVALAGGSFTTVASVTGGPQYPALTPSAIPDPPTYMPPSWAWARSVLSPGAAGDRRP